VFTGDVVVDVELVSQKLQHNLNSSFGGNGWCEGRCVVTAPSEEVQSVSHILISCVCVVILTSYWYKLLKVRGAC
jgi:hypothetical protein